MRVKISQSVLSESLKIVSRAIMQKQVMPILTGILLEAKENRLRLFSTSLEIGIEHYIECEVLEEGSVVVPGSLFQNYISKLNNETIDISTNEKTINISTLNSHLNIKKFDSKEFPSFGVFEGKPIILSQEDLKYLFEKTKFAVSQNNNEFNTILTSMKLKNENNNLITVGTNTFKLSYTQKDININSNIDVNIPFKTVDILSKILNKGNVEIYSKNNMLKFDLKDYIVYSQVMNGDFPNYKVVIPQEYNTEIKVDKTAFKSALERAALLDNESVVKIQITDDLIKIKEYGSQIGSVEEIVECEKTGNDIIFNMSSKYLLESFKVISGEVITLKSIGKNSPIVIQESDDNWKYLIMPVRDGSGF